MQPNRLFWAGRYVCVTGGSGFLGYHLVEQLLALNARVRVLALPCREDHPLRGRPVETVFGDVRQRNTVRRAVAGCSVVFHTAGIVAVSGPALASIHSVHVDGTRQVLAAADRNATVVHTSSVVTVGASRDRQALTEASPFNLHDLRVDYVQAKRAAEELALEAARLGQRVVVTNPAYLVGPGDYERSELGRLCARFWKGQMLVVPPGGYNFVDVRDAARGHLLAVEHGQAGRRYILGGHNHSFPEFFALLAEAGGREPWTALRLPGWTLAALACLATGRERLTGKPAFPSFQHLRLNRFFWYSRSDRAATELGYCPRPLPETLADTYRWQVERGLPGPRGLNGWWMRARRAA